MSVNAGPSSTLAVEGESRTDAALEAIQVAIEIVDQLGVEYSAELDDLLRVKLAIARRFHGITPETVSRSTERPNVA